MVTGGAGYIGSHICTVLLKENLNVIIMDNFANSSKRVVDRIREIGADCKGLLVVEVTDMRDQEQISQAFSKYRIKAVIHLAGLKAVGESVKEPVMYYHTNIGITCNLLNVMRTYGISMLVHSSSATVYGDPPSNPIAEDSPLAPLSPYGRSKQFIESIISDAYNSSQLQRVCILRYFNPVGAHPSGRIGEDPKGVPNNLMPAVAQCAVGRLAGKGLCVFGDDYDTIDGTGVRDYIHVMDLARGHVLALQKLQSSSQRLLSIYNLGTGTGYSVLQVIKTFEMVSERSISYNVTGRRAGDVPILLAAVEKAKKGLGFVANLGLEDMCKDHWRWQKTNPNGY